MDFPIGFLYNSHQAKYCLASKFRWNQTSAATYQPGEQEKVTGTLTELQLVGFQVVTTCRAFLNLTGDWDGAKSDKSIDKMNI